MPIQEKHINPIWGIWKIEETLEDLLGFLDRKELYYPFVQNVQGNRSIEWLAIRVLLKELLGEEKEIRYYPSGQPYLSDKSFFISITHTKNYVALILSENQQVGIDIEYISPRIRKIRDRFLSTNEISNISFALEDVHLLLHWSAKESMYKLLGEQDVSFKDNFQISLFNPILNEFGTFHANETKTCKKYYFSIHYIVRSDYLLTFTCL